MNNKHSILEQIIYFGHRRKLEKNDSIIYLIHANLDWIHFLFKQQGCDITAEIGSHLSMVDLLIKSKRLLSEWTIKEYFDYDDKVSKHLNNTTGITSDEFLDLTFVFSEVYKQLNQFKKAGRIIITTECIKDIYNFCENNLSE